MITIDIVTTTRAEYGLMRPLIRRLMSDDFFDARLIVSGTHISERHGLTYKEIESDGIPIYKKINIMSDAYGCTMVSNTMANALVEFTKHFENDKPDFLLVDGDRYEIMSIVTAAVNTNVPCIHLSGGATTEGAADECYRHAITKMSYLHFPTTDVYRQRIIQMGEDPKRVFTVGSLGVENILSSKLLNKQSLERSIAMKLDKPYAVVTFHPVTLENNTETEQINELLNACTEVDDMKFIFTMANADNGGEKINKLIYEYGKKNKDRVLCVDSLGSTRYLSALRYCDFVIGNSSSGIIEAPSFFIPTINIGDRQKGRIQAQSIINCSPKKNEILKAINKARTNEFRDECKRVINPNGDGKTSEKIIEKIKMYINNDTVDVKKKFYDLNTG